MKKFVLLTEPKLYNNLYSNKKHTRMFSSLTSSHPYFLFPTKKVDFYTVPATLFKI